MILEVGYVGRWSRDLFGNIDLNHIPYMFTPKGTNQSFAQAFDKVAAQLQAGTSTRAVTAQPALEALLGGLSSPLCSGSASVWGTTQAPFASCTAAAAEFDSQNGNPYWPSHGAGALWNLIEPSFVTGPMVLGNTQVAGNNWNKNERDSHHNPPFRAP